MKELNGIAYAWETETAALESGRQLSIDQGNVGDRRVLLGDVVISEKWKPERRIVLPNIDLLWFGVHLRRQLTVMGRMKLDEIAFSDPEQNYELLLFKEDDLLLVKNLGDRSQPTVRLDFREFKVGFSDFRHSLWQDILRRYPAITSHPRFSEFEHHFR